MEIIFHEIVSPYRTSHIDVDRPTIDTTDRRKQTTTEADRWQRRRSRVSRATSTKRAVTRRRSAPGGTAASCLLRRRRAFANDRIAGKLSTTGVKRQRYRRSSDLRHDHRISYRLPIARSKSRTSSRLPGYRNAVHVDVNRSDDPSAIAPRRDGSRARTRRRSNRTRRLVR